MTAVQPSPWYAGPADRGCTSTQAHAKGILILGGVRGEKKETEFVPHSTQSTCEFEIRLDKNARESTIHVISEQGARRIL